MIATEAELSKEEMDNSAQDDRCGECGSRLSVAWGGYWGIDGYVLRCGKNAEHATTVKYSYQRQGFDIDKGWIDMTTETRALALPSTEPGMLQRVQEAAGFGRFPSKATPAQLQELAKVAFIMGLDPLMGEIMPYQGHPYITIEGRRRLDARNGYKPSIKYRPLSLDERQALLMTEEIAERDVVWWCDLSEDGVTVEGFGRVLEAERHGEAHLPTVKHPTRMAQKRAEYHARRQKYGPSLPPIQELANVTILEEGDVVEGQARIVDEPEPTPNPRVSRESQPNRGARRSAPKLGNCANHNKAWAPGLEGRIGHPLGEGKWCWKDEVEKAPPPPEDTGDIFPPENAEADAAVPAQPSGAEPNEPQDREELQTWLEADGWAWSVFEDKVLKMSWVEWEKLSGTAQTAWVRFLKYQEQEGD